MTNIEFRLQQYAIALPILIKRLTDYGYRFTNPTDVLPGVELEVECNIQRIEQTISHVPYALAQFWRTIGNH